jgi:hypothetical protein
MGGSDESKNLKNPSKSHLSSSKSSKTLSINHQEDDDSDEEEKSVEKGHLKKNHTGISS